MRMVTEPDAAAEVATENEAVAGVATLVAPAPPVNATKSGDWLALLLVLKSTLRKGTAVAVSAGRPQTPANANTATRSRRLRRGRRPAFDR